jgi:myo-inositol-1(or 4)-monophosphatase
MSAAKRHGIDDLSAFAMDFIHQAGEKAMRYYGKGKPEKRFDQGIVTQAELELSELFNSQLNKRFPEHHSFQIDHVNEAYSHGGERYLWIFDPLDGVANFQAGIPVWGVSLALLDNFWPIFGVVYMPATDDLFHARAGQAAFWGNRRLTISAAEVIDDESLLLTYSRFHQHYRTNFPGKIRNLGCASTHLCYVAMGRADAAIVANESYQGLAAARVIVESAGGKFSKFDGSDFHLNEYLDGQKIDDHLLITAPAHFSQVKNSLKPSS